MEFLFTVSMNHNNQGREERLGNWNENGGRDGGGVNECTYFFAD